jgi:alpha/beta superfamily hydrolase
MAFMSFMMPAGAVQLEALLREPRDAVRGAVVVCHPHPVYGGTMDNKIVYRAAKAATEAGFAALRFNFRGVGRSTGQFDRGVGEKEDVTAAIHWLEDKYRSLPLALIGYSFGAWVGLQVGCLSPNIKALIGLAPPLDLYKFDFLISNSRPSLYIVGTRDEFCSLENINRLETRLPTTSSVSRIEDAEHFFANRVEEIEVLIANFFRTQELNRDEA